MNRRIYTGIDRARLYIAEVENAIKHNDPIAALAMAAELAEIARRLCNQFQKEINRLPKKPKTL